MFLADLYNNKRLSENISPIDLAEILFNALMQKYPEAVKRYGHEVVGDAVMNYAEDTEDIRSMSDVDIAVQEIMDDLANYRGDKTNELEPDGEAPLQEDLRKWFKEKWVRFGPDGEIRGACARGDESEGKPKCLPQAKAHALGKKGRKYAAAKKRREDPNPERRGPAKNVATKKKSNEGVAEGSISHAELAKLAHDAYVAASRKGNGPMAAHYLKQYLKHKADAAKDKKGVAEGKGELWRVLEPRNMGGHAARYYVVKGQGKQLKMWRSKSGAGDFIKRSDAEAKAEELNKNVTEAQSAKTGIYQTDVLGAKAYHAKCMEPNCNWESKRFDKIKQAQAAAEKHAKSHFKQGVAEGTQTVGHEILGMLRQVKRQGHDAMEELYSSCPLLAQYWDQYEGDFRSMVIELSPKTLNRIKAEIAAFNQQGVAEAQQLCPECGGPAFSDLMLAEKQDACYHKVKSRYKVWPSAYASGALVQCRKKGAANWGKKKTNETRFYFSPKATLAETLRSDFAMIQDSEGWYLTAAQGPAKLLEAQRAFGIPKVKQVKLKEVRISDYTGRAGTIGDENATSPIGSLPRLGQKPA